MSLVKIIINIQIMHIVYHITYKKAWFIINYLCKMYINFKFGRTKNNKIRHNKSGLNQTAVLLCLI